VAIYPDNCSSVDELLGNADLALYKAKADGRGRYAFFNREIRNALEARRTLESELKEAAEKQEFKLFYQPQFNLKDGRLVGAEALIRWSHPKRGLVSPAEFMPVVNASSISNDVAFWVLETACRQGRLWQKKGHDIRIGVNLSPSQLQSGNLAATVGRILSETGLSPALLELEVTEGILIEDDAKALDIFHHIQDLGVQIAFDDFGTGYASLSYLKKFPLNGLKSTSPSCVNCALVRTMRRSSAPISLSSCCAIGCRRHRGPCYGRSALEYGMRKRARVLFRPSHAGNGI
jgi:predicted signal transduction protein with EAL and GGDEF domain